MAQTFPLEHAELEQDDRYKQNQSDTIAWIISPAAAVRTGGLRLDKFWTQIEPLTSAIDAYKSFDRHQRGWIKVKLEPRKEETNHAERHEMAAAGAD